MGSSAEALCITFPVTICLGRVLDRVCNWGTCVSIEVGRKLSRCPRCCTRCSLQTTMASTSTMAEALVKPLSSMTGSFFESDLKQETLKSD